MNRLTTPPALAMVMVAAATALFFHASAAAAQGRSPLAADAFRVALPGVEGEATRRRTDPEALSLRLGGGTYGAYGAISFATLRFEYLYLCLARFVGGGGRPDLGGKRRVFATMGIAVGVPWHLDGYGRHELRFGLGIGAGAVRERGVCVSEEPEGVFDEARRECDLRMQGFGVVMAPEVVYVWRPAGRISFRLGVDLQLATSPNAIFDDAPSGDDEVEYPSPVFNGFLGFGF